MRRKEEKKTPVVEASNYQMFSEVDINHHGNVGSYLPAWAYTQLIMDLENDINDAELQVNKSNISADKANELKRVIKLKKERLDEILNSRPSVDVDKVNDISKTIGEKIADSMFSRTDMMRGTADAHTEAYRMVQPCIKLSDEEANFAVGCNVVPNRDRMISRNQAAKLWKIAQRYLGNNSNIEILRRG
jgi:hypothetical protein